jgi:hypothetical protein
MTTSERETLGVNDQVTRRAVSRASVRRSRRGPSRRRYRTGRWVPVARIAVSLLVSATVAAVLWATRPTSLQQPDDIVGYPSFFDYNYLPVFLAHRILVWVLPLVTALSYVVLTRFGPLAAPPTSSDVATATEAAEPADDEAPEPDGRIRAVRLVPAAAVLVVGLSAGTSIVHQHLSAVALLAAAAYVVLALALALVVRRVTGRSDALSIVNAIATPVAALTGLYLFAHRTGTVDRSGRFQAWPWLPLWLVVVAGVVLVGWVTWRQVRGDDPARTERWVVSGFAGSVLVFMLAAQLPGAVSRIQGFDDMHAVTGADLMTRGYFPWRDVLFMHGVFEDGLRANAGFAMFQHSVWGAQAASAMLWLPLLCVGYYLLAVWAAPRQWVLHLAVVAAVPWASRFAALSVRWVAVGFLFLLLGHALRRSRVLPTVLFTAVLFGTAVLVPEESFLVIAVAVVLVVHDLTRTNADGRPWWRRLYRTRDFAVAGAALTVAWCLFLLIMGALGAWVDYYLYFGPGHAASGALPLGLVDVGGWRTVFVVLEIVTVVALVWSIARLVLRRTFDARHGVMLAATITTGLYAEKALARFDIGHIGQVVTVAICLWIVMAAIALDGLGSWAGRLAEHRDRQSADAISGASAARLRRRRTVTGARHGGAVVLLLGTAMVVPIALGLPNIGEIANAAPSHNRAAVPSQTGNPPLIGYTKRPGTDMQMVSDLSLLLNTLTPPGGTVYDFTNSPGYFTYLMQQELPTRFYTVGLALPEVAQQALLDELEDAKPAVVVFDDLFYGLPIWDGPRNEVRHYLVSPYLLANWTPVVTTYGFLVMVRNDLVDDLPPLPSLHEPMLTDDLYFSMPVCAWGHIPDYLHATPTGDVETLSVGDYEKRRLVRGSGWAYDAAADAPVRRVLLAVGNQVLGQAETDISRPDVAGVLGLPGAASSGFSFSGLTEDHGALRGFAILSDGTAHVIGRPRGHVPNHLEMPDGQVVKVSPGSAAGGMDTVNAVTRSVAPVEVPDGVDLADYGLATFVAGSGPLGDTALRLFDNASSVGLSRDITFRASRPDSSAASVRVGACLQWHGYSGRDLYLAQEGGRPVTEIRLSQVAAD